MKAVGKALGFFFITVLVTLPALADDPFFTVSENRTAHVLNAQKEAMAENKLLLLVVGANWCHDSRALGRYLQQDIVQASLSSYVVAKVDAAWLDDLTSLLAPYGHPAYFGTPSVMIIDPNTNQVLNRASIQRWQSAHSESAQALAFYLSEYAQQATELKHETQTPPIASLVAFEAQHAERLYAAYAILGKLLEQEKSGEPGGDPNALDVYWREVATYRYQLQNDLSQLHRQQLDNEHIFPEYPPLSFL